MRGAETYVMATQKAAANLEISKKENAAMMLEENYRETYKNFDPSDLASNIGKSLEQFSTIKNSILWPPWRRKASKIPDHGKTWG